MKTRIAAAVVCLTSLAAFAGDSCKEAAKNLAPLIAMSAKGAKAKPEAVKAAAEEAEKLFAAKCAA